MDARRPAGRSRRVCKRQVPENDIPSDGLVLLYDDIAYGESLGRTAKFPRNSIAFKWKDEVRETTFPTSSGALPVTGLINPVAVFEPPVELERNHGQPC